jgi:hypothetical protein
MENRVGNVRRLDSDAADSKTPISSMLVSSQQALMEKLTAHKQLIVTPKTSSLDPSGNHKDTAYQLMVPTH